MTKAKSNMVTKELLRTHCWYCQKETNQKTLLDEFQLITEEIVWRNEEGDENQSVWTNIGSIWLVSKCLGCDNLTFKHILRASPNKTLDKIFYYPRKPIREIPKWISKLPKKYLEVLQEVYASVQEELYILSLIGTRTLLDIFITNNVGDVGTFKQKIDRLIENNIITSSKAKVLETSIEAGNASAHRGYKPDKDTLFQVLDIVENLLQSEIVDRPIEQIKQKTPTRKK